MVTDFDCWHPGHDAVTVQDIVKCSRPMLRRRNNNLLYDWPVTFHANVSRARSGLIARSTTLWPPGRERRSEAVAEGSMPSPDFGGFTSANAAANSEVRPTNFIYAQIQMYPKNLGVIRRRQCLQGDLQGGSSARRLIGSPAGSTGRVAAFARKPRPTSSEYAHGLRDALCALSGLS